MIRFEKTESFDAWLKALKDPLGKARILSRLTAAENGNFGVCAPVGEGVSEMKIDTGPGYRIYFKRTGQVVYLLLLGGSKRTQTADIAKAKRLAKGL